MEMIHELSPEEMEKVNAGAYVNPQTYEMYYKFSPDDAATLADYGLNLTPYTSYTEGTMQRMTKSRTVAVWLQDHGVPVERKEFKVYKYFQPSRMDD